MLNDINRAGRGGLGAVMGSKRLKAVATRGTLRVPVAERSRIGAVSKWLGDNYKTCRLGCRNRHAAQCHVAGRGERTAHQ